MIRPRLTREQRAERFRATRERWAVTLEPETRAVFERLLDEVRTRALAPQPEKAAEAEA